MDIATSTPAALLRNWVRQHAVCWEIAPLVELQDRKEVRVGFEMHLLGRSDSSARGPGAPEDRALYHGLEALAEEVMPPDLGSARCEVGPDLASYHYRRATGWVPEVQLTLRLVHRSGYFSPIDADETRCAEEIRARLRSLGCGVQHGPGEGPTFR